MYKGCGIFLLLILLSGCSPFAHSPKANNGYLDLSQWNFAESGVIKLDGAWEFYWDQLYTPLDFKDTLPVKNPTYLAIPSSWNNLSVDGKPIPGQGFATYRLRVSGMPQGIMALRIPDAFSAYRLWVNDELLSENGIVGKDAETELAEARPRIKAFTSKAENEIVVQVSNFIQLKGGIAFSIEAGTVDQIMHAWNTATALNIFLIGMMMILFIYHVFIFLSSRSDYNTLWFSLICLFIALRSLATNERFLVFFFPDISYSLLSSIEYESAFGAALLFGVFLHGLYPKEFSTTMLKLFVGYGIVEFVFLFVTPVSVYSSFIIVYQVVALVEILYYIWVAVKAVRSQRKFAPIMLGVILIVLLLGLNDMLYAHLIINTMFAIPFGIPALLVVQAYIIAHRIGDSIKGVEKLSGQLNVSNLTLEQKVTERTAELEKEKVKADDLLLNILPLETANELKEKGYSHPRTYSMVSVMFIQISGLSAFREDTESAAALAEISLCFDVFDDILETHGLEKIKTIGDIFLCASGMPVPVLRHTEQAVNAALEILAFIQLRKKDRELKDEKALNVKIGISVGPVVAGIVGSRKFAYDIWGDTVNTAARLMQHSEPGKINISGQVHKVLKNKYGSTYRGKIEAKNKGVIDMYYVGPL